MAEITETILEITIEITAEEILETTSRQMETVSKEITITAKETAIRNRRRRITIDAEGMDVEQPFQNLFYVFTWFEKSFV